MPGSDRMDNERGTIKAMTEMYCASHHQTTKGILCGTCTSFLKYAEQRLANCPFQAEKPTCANCTVHCYKKDMRNLAREIMRYAGPRMILRHPVMAIRHLLASRIKPLALNK
ncbi:nitrous oxide-stimulated promoter family protein [Desulfopila sp. IMCC35008]|uniref:nitrous oxide-stimulated promoter family protein n=1 Tax=Desulfopila sp. IMCC35008 TaxID=2653858 RepID=UPI0013D39235|nr:nitrous oxide-stimulated promoter family protein [Desulfopila sp. IMCC35008]